MYRIYHVIGKKVGCTRQLIEDRCRQQNLWEGYVVEALDLIPDEFGRRFAGDLEQYYCDYYGYNRGRHYSAPNWNDISPEKRSKSRVSAMRNPNHAFITGAATRAALASPKHNSKTGTLQRAGAKAAIASPNHNSKLTRICKYCGLEIRGLVFYRHIKSHKDIHMIENMKPIEIPQMALFFGS
jgi:hypothetical protein